MENNKALTLYDIEEHWLALLDTEEMVEDEAVKLDILDDIERAGEARIAKINSTVGFLRFCTMMQAGIDTEIARMKKYRETFAKAERRTEAYVIGVIERLVPQPKRGPKKLEGTIGVMSLRKGPDTAVVDDPAVIPPAYKDVTLKLSGVDMARIRGILHAVLRSDLLEAFDAGRTDKPRLLDIRKALKGGAEIQGADLRFGASSLVVK